MTKHGSTELYTVLGSGPSGLAVLDELLRLGRRARVVNRSGRAAVPAGVEVCAGDLTDSAFVRSAAEGSAVVYNCVGLPYARWVTDFPPLLDSLLTGTGAAGAKLVTLDNLYAYGRPDGPLTEDTPYRAQTRKGQTRIRMARMIEDAHARGVVQVAVARASDFFGPRGTVGSPLGARVIPPALAGKRASVLGNPDLPHTYTYLPDLGRALVVLGDQPAAYGEVWHVPNAPTATTRAIVTQIFEEIGREPKLSPVPRLALRALGLFNPTIRELLEMLYEFDAPFEVDSSKFVRAFGELATPLAEQVSATVAWFRANPQAG